VEEQVYVLSFIAIFCMETPYRDKLMNLNPTLIIKTSYKYSNYATKITFMTGVLGLRELCWNNFGNFEATEYSRIILRIIGE